MTKNREQRLQAAQNLLKQILADGQEHDIREVQQLIRERHNVGRRWVTAIRRTLPIVTLPGPGVGRWSWKWAPTPRLAIRTTGRPKKDGQ